MNAGSMHRAFVRHTNLHANSFAGPSARCHAGSRRGQRVDKSKIRV
jgi:hypothetical protein